MVTDDSKTDAKLVTACKRGDSSSFEQLVAKYQKQIFNIAYRVSGNYDDACDITQEAFITAWRKIGDFRGEAQFSTWLTAIAINLSRNRLEQINAGNRREAYSLDAGRNDAEDAKAVEIRCGSPDSLDLLQEEELRRFINECINKLPVEFREVIVLRDIQELSYDEVSVALALKDGTVRSRLFRARESVRDCLKMSAGIL
jgi:RNA polymerase sigma-70 factor, ECF subfamily